MLKLQRLTDRECAARVTVPKAFAIAMSLLIQVSTLHAHWSDGEPGEPD